MTATTTAKRTRTRVEPKEIEDQLDDQEVPWDEDEDERPARAARRKPAAKEEADEDERPARAARRKPSPSDDEEEAPVTRKKRPAARDEEEEVEGSGEETAIPVARGRAAVKKSRPSMDSLYFKWADDGEEQLVKFLPDADGNICWSYNQHWVTRGGKQSFPCLGKECPLCEIGARISQKVVYTVLNLSHDDGPTVQVMEVSQMVDDDLAALDSAKSTGPLDRLFWAASRPKKDRPVGLQKYNYKFMPIKPRDVEEEWSIDIADVDRAIAKAEVPGSSKVLGKVTRRMLQEIADEVMDR